MASVVKIKRSSVQGKAPTTSDLETGEIALNLRDKKLFSSDGSAVFEVGSNVHSISVGTGGLTFANGDMTMPTADGTSGQVLTTDGSGNLSFQDANYISNGDIATLSSLEVTGNLTVDTSTLFVDAGNNRVGIGTTSPAYQFEIENTGGNALLVLDRTDGAATFIEGGATASVLGSVGANDVKIAYNSVPVVTIGSGGAITTSGNIRGGSLRADNFTTENAFAVVGSDNNLIQDTTLSVDPSSNYLGINQTSPEVTLHMTGEGAQTAQIRMEQYNDSADAPDVRTRRYRGTISSPSAVQAGDYLFRSNHEYWNGSSLLVGGAFAFDNTNNANRTQFSVAVDTDGTGANPQGNNGQFKIDGNDGGAITFNNAYKFPTSDGSANQVLQTDGNGNIAWEDVSSATVTLNDAVVSGNTTYREITVGGVNIANNFSLPVQDGAALQILQTDGSGTVSWVALEQAEGGGFNLGTLTSFPEGDLHEGGAGTETYIGELGDAGTDPFGISLGALYDCMDPVGRIVTADLGALT